MFLLPAFLTTIFFSLSAVTANRLAKMLGGLSANFWRISLAAVFLGIWAHTYGPGLGGRAFPLFLLSGFVGFGIGDAALYQALPRIGSRLTVMLVHCLAAPFAAVVEWAWLDTRLTGLQVALGAMILVGVMVALAPSEHLHIPRRTMVVGIVCGVIAAFGQGFGAVLSRKAFQVAADAGESIDGLSSAYQRILAGWVTAGVLLVVARQHQRWFMKEAEATERTGRWQEAAPWVVVNALSGPTLGVGCYQWALASTPTGLVLPIVALTPLVVIPFVRYMEGEKPSGRSLAGGVLAVAGAVALTMI